MLPPRRFLFLPAFAAVLLVAPASAASAVPAATVSPRACAETLACRIGDIARMPMADRLMLVHALQEGRAQSFEKGFARWNVIEGVIQVFLDEKMGAPGTWASYTNAGDIEAILRGVALAAGVSDDDYGDPGARPWARYLTDLKAGRLARKAVHDNEWGTAEQAAIDWGRDPANNPAHPDRSENAIFVASQAYRALLRNEPAIITVLRTLHDPVLSRCYDWLTDVTNRKAIRVAGTTIITIAREPLNVPAVAHALTRLASLFPECARPRAASMDA
ncbi:hypothetical protein BTM25_04050 [Actinomadura rubteroloni]|uniref:ADP-ribosylglycohydrolase family protein n=1 Tax=Actinomadura rubteroloni TaxID=1926885 RepID=A0A2P4ULU7_9ACTN|nr:hypothetical protein [Actinomadura rubteroloni]POM26021.1 hypothetical protein BTM25_04050 [Actinomadura rubteroloni]